MTALLAGSAAPCPAASPGVEKAVRSLADRLLKSGARPGSSIAVPPFSAPAAPAGLGRAVADALARELLRSGRFTVIEGDFLAAPGRAPADLGGAAYVVEGSISPSGKKKLEFQARLLAAATGPVLASAKTTIKTAEAAAGDPAVEQAEVKVLPGTGPGSCRWIESRVTASGKTEALLAARRSALGAAMSLPPSRTPEFGADPLRGKEEAVLRALRSGRVAEEKVAAEGLAGGGYSLTLHTCVNAAGLSRDKGFAAELLVSQQRLFAGQKLRAAAVSNRDGFVHFLRTDLAGNLTPLDAAQPAGNRVLAGRPFSAPPCDVPQPEGEKPSFFIARALAVRRDVSPLIARALSYPDLLRRLDESGDEWAEDARVLTVYPRP